jgi:uncharacterized MAPEG superfamily protein
MFLNKVFEDFPIKVNPFIALMIIFAVAFVPHFMKGWEVKQKLVKAGKPYSIAHSRQQTVTAIADDTPEAKRIAVCNGCHLNGLEAFQLFTVAILSTILMKVPRARVEGASAAFILIRVIYTSVYIGPLNGIMRTMVWGVGVFVCMDLLLQAAALW